MQKETDGEFVTTQKTRENIITRSIGLGATGYASYQVGNHYAYDTIDAFLESKACREQPQPGCTIHPYANLEMAGVGLMVAFGGAALTIITSKATARMLGMTEITTTRRTPTGSPAGPYFE